MGLQAQMKRGAGPLVFCPDKNHREHSPVCPKLVGQRQKVHLQDVAMKRFQ